MRVLVFGSAGMLGRVVVKALRAAAHDVVPYAREPGEGIAGFDVVRDLTGLTELLGASRCELAVNCAGVAASPALRDDGAARSRALAVNTIFPLALAEAAQHSGRRLVHISSDGVFSGRAREPYVETDEADPIDDYGRTRALGESPAANALSVRCSLIGVDRQRRRGLVEWFLEQPEGGHVRGFEDQRWNGVTTLQLAAVIVSLTERRTFDAARSCSSVHHFCPNAETTKYHLLLELNAATGNRRTVFAAESGLSTRGRLLTTRYAVLNALVSPEVAWSDLLTQLLLTRRGQ